MFYIYCAGGFGKELLDIAIRSRINDSEIKFVDDITPNKSFNAIPIIRYDELVRDWNKARDMIVIANGAPSSRLKIYNRLLRDNISTTTFIDNSCIISPGAKIGRGVIVCPQCIISRDAILGDNTVVNAMSIVGHDASIGHSTVISSQVNLGGSSCIAENVFVGMGSLVRERVSVGKNTVVSMGSHVMRDLPPNIIAVGSPARPMRTADGHQLFK
jgi:sugar O-acyltransferase (sialic acid O-acetyltransferase NeuD family)